MSSVRARNGAAVTVLPTHRITSIAGLACELYLISDKPEPVADIEPDLLYAEKVVIEPLTFVGGVVTVGTAATFMAQVEYVKARQHGKEQSPDKPETTGNLTVKAANQKQVSKLITFDFADSLTGKAFANTYAFARVNETVTGADPDGGDPGSRTPVPVSIVYDALSLSTQYDSERGKEVVIGDAMVLIDRERVTVAQLEAADYFTLTPQGGQPERYTLWNSDGIRYPKTHHYAVYLQREKQ